MSFFASRIQNYKSWDYITGNNKMSIMVSRYYYLQDLAENNNIKVSLRDPETNKWTKWKKFPGDLRQTTYNKFMGRISQLSVPFDVHRSMLPNEIVVESDYLTYQENFEAMQVAGRIFENKGFSPLYYFSGNKSVHCHIYLSWDFLYILDQKLKKKLYDIFYKDVSRFKKEFIEWLRKKIISCWDTDLIKFDKDLIKGTHLIRCELSKNKQGYKTFLGYSYRDLSFIPSICNEDNKIYPELGEIRLSTPPKIMDMVEDFVDKIIASKKNKPTINYNHNLPMKMRGCVRAFLSNDFFEANDGTKRGLFVIISETRRCMDDFKAKIVVNDWNSRLNKPFPQKEIDTRFNNKIYTLSCYDIHSILDEIKVSYTCSHNNNKTSS